MKLYKSFLFLALISFSFLSPAIAEASNDLWAKSTVSALDSSYFESVATDSSGNIYAAGFIFDPDIHDFGNGVTVSGTGGINVVLVKYNSSGEAQWAKSVISGSNESYFYSVALDGNGNIYTVGKIKSTGAYDFGNSVTVNGADTGYNVVLVKYNSSGEAQWAKSVVTSSEKSEFNSVTVDDSGNIYAAGYIYGTGAVDFGNSVTVSGSDSDKNAVLVKYNSSGEAEWAKSTASASNFSEFNSVAVDDNGNIYTSGYILGTNIFDFGNGVTVIGAYSARNVVLIKYNSNGEAQWAKSVVSASGMSDFKSVAVDDSGNIYAAGLIWKTNNFDFGNGVTVNGPWYEENTVLVKYNSSGDAQWAKSTVKASSRSEFHSVAVDDNGNIYSAGYILGTKIFDFRNGVTVIGDSDGYNVLLVKYSSSGEAEWAKSTVIAPNDDSKFASVAVADVDTFYAAGYIDGTDIYNFGNNTVVNGAYVGSNVVLVKYDNNLNPTEPDTTDAGSATTAAKWSTLLGLGTVILMAL